MMPDPVTSLLTVLGTVGFLGWLFWPDRGLLAKWRRMRTGVNRILLEDALKHLHECDYNGISCTVNSVSGSLGTSADHASQVVAKLESMGLIQSEQNGVLRLTGAGRSYALRVIRVHRLWERYLADETGLSETDWHRHAEDIEHRLSPAEANELAARMGNPQVDPHGDPIPTSSGEIHVRTGIGLNQLEQGVVAEIVHIEDEPPALYAQLVAERLHVGQQIRVIATEADRIHFEAEGSECVLAPLLAAQIMVKRLDRGENVVGSYRTLDSMETGDAAIVAGISHACRGMQRRRLMDLGIVPGSVIVAELRGASGDPVAYRVRGALIALRKKQSQMIFVTPIHKEKTDE